MSAGLTRLRARLSPSLTLTVGLLLVLAGTSAADLIRTDRATLLPLVFVPLLGGIGLTVRPALLVSACSTTLAVVLPGALFTNAGIQYVRFCAVVGVCIASVATSFLRRRLAATADQLAREKAAVEAEQRRSLAGSDAVYQRLVAAKIWQDLGDDEKATDALKEALATASELIDDRLTKLDEPLGTPERSEGRVINLMDGDGARSSDR